MKYNVVYVWAFFPIMQLLNIATRKRQTDPSGGHSMKQLTRTLESVMKDKERWWSCHRVKQMKEITKHTVESWNRKKTQYINGKKMVKSELSL